MRGRHSADRAGGAADIAVDMMDNASALPTATTTREDSLSKMAQNHPHDFTKRQLFIKPNGTFRPISWLYATPRGRPSHESTGRIFEMRRRLRANGEVCARSGEQGNVEPDGREMASVC